jgi:thiosulfate/3-mercaptopyruvate sulfurtransferase
MSNFVSPEWVNKHVNDDLVVIFDCRFSLAEPAYGIEAYKKDHIEGAFYADLEKDLSGPVQVHGGRHPLPSVNILSQFFSRCGVSEEKKVIAYDDQSCTMASRLWWLLKYLGHEKVYVMQGGYTNYKEKGYDITSKLPEENPTSFQAKADQSMVIDREGLSRYIQSQKGNIIDAREELKYKGLTEPIDSKAGHIPTSRNVPWQNNFSEPGWWLPKEKLQEIYKHILSGENNPVAYCGSGVTACVNILAMNEAGIKDVTLYPGSWSDWISYPENPIVSENE